MRRTNKPLLRAAAAIHAQLMHSHDVRPAVSLPREPWQHMQRVAQQIAHAQRRALHRAAGRLLADLACHADRLHRELSTQAAQWRKEAERSKPRRDLS